MYCTIAIDRPWHHWHFHWQDVPTFCWDSSHGSGRKFSVGKFIETLRTMGPEPITSRLNPTRRCAPRGHLGLAPRPWEVPPLGPCHEGREGRNHKVVQSLLHKRPASRSSPLRLPLSFECHSAHSGKVPQGARPRHSCCRPRAFKGTRHPHRSDTGIFTAQDPFRRSKSQRSMGGGLLFNLPSQARLNSGTLHAGQPRNSYGLLTAHHPSDSSEELVSGLAQTTP